MLARTLRPFGVYPREERWESIAQTDVPILLLQGTLDPATTVAVAEPLAEALTGPYQTYVPIPHLTHSLLWIDCVQDLIEQFAAEPTGNLDTTCTLDIPPPNFDYPPDWSMQWLGTTDAWENP